MSKVAVVYWSGTGNTETMAMAVAEGAKGKGAEVSVITAAEFSPEQVGEYSAIAFGCPSMGSSSWRRASSSRCSLIWRVL